MIRTAVTRRISLFVQLSCFCFVAGITITNKPGTIVRESPEIVTAKYVKSVVFPERDKILKTPSQILVAPRNSDYGFYVNPEVETARTYTSENKRVGVIPLGWNEYAGVQEGGKYLPPRRTVVDSSYGPPGVVPIEVSVDTTLSTPSYSSQSWNSHPYVQRVKSSEEPKRLHRIVQKHENRELPGHAVVNEKNLPLGDTRPVYEFTKNDDDASYEVSNDGRDYEGQHRQQQHQRNQPEGNRAREQSTSPNTVTRLDSHHRTNEQRHESPGDTSIASASSSLSTLDWFLTDKGYNSPIHPPPNPFVSLILSHYGRYVPGPEQPKIYSYMAVNNIHNNKPFGQYKLSCDEGPDLYFVK